MICWIVRRGRSRVRRGTMITLLSPRAGVRGLRTVGVLILGLARVHLFAVFGSGAVFGVGVSLVSTVFSAFVKFGLNEVFGVRGLKISFVRS